eukprot:TRINITY_DN2023_c0_g1_i1.p1 TRINITY_DN2023_c0_g1~~TRINITY_DN2023_c0_g1_i1.p1  ORF type:complete len:492 (+),score=79.82 TRINITY_DN2023_c0_g1_i1:102-1577(+)
MCIRDRVSTQSTGGWRLAPMQVDHTPFPSPQSHDHKHAFLCRKYLSSNVYNYKRGGRWEGGIIVAIDEQASCIVVRADKRGDGQLVQRVPAQADTHAQLVHDPHNGFWFADIDEPMVQCVCRPRKPSEMFKSMSHDACRMRLLVPGERECTQTECCSQTSFSKYPQYDPETKTWRHMRPAKPAKAATPTKLAKAVSPPEQPRPKTPNTESAESPEQAKLEDSTPPLAVSPPEAPAEALESTPDPPPQEPTPASAPDPEPETVVPPAEESTPVAPPKAARAQDHLDRVTAEYMKPTPVVKESKGRGARQSSASGSTRESSRSSKSPARARDASGSSQNPSTSPRSPKGGNQAASKKSEDPLTPRRRAMLDEEERLARLEKRAIAQEQRQLAASSPPASPSSRGRAKPPKAAMETPPKAKTESRHETRVRSKVHEETERGVVKKSDKGLIKTTPKSPAKTSAERDKRRKSKLSEAERLERLESRLDDQGFTLG